MERTEILEPLLLLRRHSTGGRIYAYGGGAEIISYHNMKNRRGAVIKQAPLLCMFPVIGGSVSLVNAGRTAACRLLFAEKLLQHTLRHLIFFSAGIYQNTRDCALIFNPIILVFNQIRKCYTGDCLFIISIDCSLVGKQTYALFSICKMNKRHRYNYLSIFLLSRHKQIIF